MRCDGKTHNLREIYRHGAIYSDTVVRWCSDCGAVVVDADVDGRTSPGHCVSMKFPLMTYPNQGKKLTPSNPGYFWSVPFYGVQHMSVAAGQGIRQITVEEHESFTLVYAFGPAGFTPVFKQECGDVEEAKRAGEAYARQMGLRI